MKRNFREGIYRCGRTVFKLRDIGILTGATKAENLKASAGYYASRGTIRKVRKGMGSVLVS